MKYLETLSIIQMQKFRIDAGTVGGMKGPNSSHYHLNMKRTHFTPGTKRDPGFKFNK